LTATALLVLLGVAASPVAAILPEDDTPYLVLMVGGFVVGIAGHLFRSRLLIVVGIVMIFLATLLLPIALDLFGDRPEQPRSV
jgi:cyanate permease